MIEQFAPGKFNFFVDRRGGSLGVSRSGGFVQARGLLEPGNSPAITGVQRRDIENPGFMLISSVLFSWHLNVSGSIA